MQKKTRLHHTLSNKTARTGCLTNWSALIGCKIKRRAATVLTVVTLYWRTCTAFLFNTKATLSLDIIFLALSGLASLPFTFQSISGKRNNYTANFKLQVQSYLKIIVPRLYINWNSQFEFLELEIYVFFLITLCYLD